MKSVNISKSDWLYKYNLFKYFKYFLQEEFEDTKGVIKIRNSKNRQHNGQKKKYKRTNNDLQNIYIKLKIFNLILTTKFNDSSILITIISWDYLDLSVANEYVGDVTIPNQVIK